MRILIVEDEKRLETLCDLLSQHGFLTDACYDGESGLDCALSGIYDLMILDVMLPVYDGFEVLRRLRGASSSLPVLLLTAKSESCDKIHGLDCGADYYLTKPFDPGELLACLRALARRKSATLAPTEELQFGDLRLEAETMLLHCGERNLRLSRKEFQLLETLMRNPKQVLSKEQLLLKVWGYDSEAEENHVEVYISFLRKKLEHLHSCVRIRTLRTVGYQLGVEQE